MGAGTASTWNSTRPMSLPSIVSMSTRHAPGFGLLLIDGFFHALDEAEDVAHAQDALRDAVGMEGL